MNWLLQLFGYQPVPGSPPARLCARCGGQSGHPVIGGEGAAVCVPCVLRNGRAAGDPASLSAGEAQLLVEAHGDVVALVRVRGWFGVSWRWSWRADWPTGGDAA